MGGMNPEVPHLPLFADRTFKGPFIPDQGLRWLNAPPDRRLECLEPARLREARTNREFLGTSVVEPSAASGSAACPWVFVNDREAFFCDASRPRLCILVEAGIGKSIALQQIAYLRTTSSPGQLVIGVPFSRLPMDPAHYLDDDNVRFLANQFCSIPDTASTPIRVAERLILRKIRDNEFTLIVDALDQTRGMDGSFRQKADGLAEFLTRHPQVQCVVSGRPHSIHGDRLFGVGASDWCFVLLEEFTEEQQQRYLGETRWRAIERLDADLIAQPRMLHEIRKLDPDELRSIRTGADLQCRVVDKVLTAAARDQETEFEQEDVYRMLALIAFGMHKSDNFDGVTSARCKEFVAHLHSEHASKDDYWVAFLPDADSLWTKIRDLSKLDEFLYAAFSTELSSIQLFFRNRTLQDFFAALWISRYSCTVGEQSWLCEHLPLAGGDGLKSSEAYRYGLWRFLAEMPRSAIGDHDNKMVPWLRSAQVLFLPFAGSDANAGRPTEMMYRAWWNLLDLAGKLPVTGQHGRRGLVERDLWQATSDLQHEVCVAYRSGTLRWEQSLDVFSGADDVSTAALRMAQQFLVEFFAVCDGRGDPGRSLQGFDIRGFVEVPSALTCFGNGVNRDDGLLVASFQLAKVPLTNRIVDLFDPQRSTRFGDYEHYSAEADCPAVFLNWYDAWCVATWLHARLPDEYEWERACRGRDPGQHGELQWSCVREADLESVAWYWKNADGRTHAVGTDAESKQPNDLGLYHMHGSVWEWTSSWHADAHEVGNSPDFVGAECIVRGGSFSSRASDCKLFVRGSRARSTHKSNQGVRVARTLRGRHESHCEAAENGS